MIENLTLTLNILKVERIIDDLRRGMPVIIDGVLVLAIEQLSPESCHWVDQSKAQCVITAKRAEYLGWSGHQGPVSIHINSLTEISTSAYQALIALAGAVQAEVLPNVYVQLSPKKVMSEAVIKIMELMNISGLLPAVVIQEKINPAEYDFPLLSIESEVIAAYDHAMRDALRPVCRAPLTLKYAPKSEIIAYRPLVGGREHYAIIIGDALKQEAPLVRVHSSCYTGDLSLIHI